MDKFAPPSAAASQQCPACPFEGLTDQHLVCPNCGTDLGPLVRLRRLPHEMIEQGSARADDRPADAIPYFSAAALWESTRADALLRLAQCHSRLGQRAAAQACLSAASALGRRDEATTIGRALPRPAAGLRRLLDSLRRR